MSKFEAKTMNYLFLTEILHFKEIVEKMMWYCL